MHPLGNKVLRGGKTWLDALLGFFYPEVCQYCGEERATADDGYIGAECRNHVRFIEPPYCERCGLPSEGDITTVYSCSNCREMDLHFSRARSAVQAQGMVLDLIHRYKYHRALHLERFLARLFVDAAVPELAGEDWTLLVPVPLHPMKQMQREFNQAERLARRLGRVLRLPVRANILQRIEPTRTQTLLSRRERAANVHRAFRLKKPALARGHRIVVVDDVLTTGATTSACARLLRRAGAADVCVWTVARGLLH